MRRIQSAMATQPQSIEPSTQRRYPIGVEVVNEIDKSAPVHARVWAPGRKSVELVNDDDPTRNSDSRLAPEGNGYFSGYTTNVRLGTRYRFRLDGGEAYPDPASRFQPDGPHGPSEVVDPTRFRWSDAAWQGVDADR